MGSTNNKTLKTHNTSAAVSPKKLFVLGLGLGFAVFFGEHLANSIGGFMVGASGISLNTAATVSSMTRIAAFIVLFAGTYAVFRRAGLQRAGQAAATSIIVTYMLVKFFAVAIKIGGIAQVVSNILLFVLVGGVATAVLARLFGRIKDNERASLVVFVVIAVALFGIGWLTDLFRQNSKLILGY